MNKNRMLPVLILLVAGLIAGGLGCYMMFFEGKDYVETKAVIADVQEEEIGTDEDGLPEYNYIVTVDYSVDGKSYSSELGYYQDGYVEGKEISIFYDPADPTKIKGDYKGGFALYLLILGPVLVLLAVIVFIKGAR